MTLRIHKMSILNNIMRPIYGPSSSHTFAPARIGYHTRKIMNPFVCKVHAKIFFLRGAEEAFRGHKSDIAVIGGLLNFSPFNEEFKKIMSLKLNDNESSNKIEYKLNSIDYIFEFFLIPYFPIEKGVAFKILIDITDEEKGISLLASSLGGGDIEINHAFPIKGKGIITSQQIASKVKQSGSYVDPEQIQKLSQSDYNFNSFQELIECGIKTKLSLSKIAIEREKILLNKKEGEILEFMKNRNWSLMKDSIELGYKGSHHGILSKDIAKNFKDLKKRQFKGREFIALTAYYAIAVMLVNSSMGRVVSCPTGGAAGIVPAVAYNYFKHQDSNSEEDIIQSLFTAGLICLIIKSNVSVSGAQHGCAAECGTARAMAAALEVDLLSTQEMREKNMQIINASKIALINSLGLPCDPIGGLVEIPCIKRNGSSAVGSHIDCLMALSNLDGFIKPDEVLSVMKKVGEDLKSCYKEGSNGLGGLATTDSAQEKMKKNMKKIKPKLTYKPLKKECFKQQYKDFF